MYFDEMNIKDLSFENEFIKLDMENLFHCEMRLNL